MKSASQQGVPSIGPCALCQLSIFCQVYDYAVSHLLLGVEASDSSAYNVVLAAPLAMHSASETRLSFEA